MDLDQTAIRQRALDNLMPAWIEGRREVADAREAVEEAKGELKRASEAQGKIDRALEHVGGCRQIACLRCDEISLNGSQRGRG